MTTTELDVNTIRAFGPARAMIEGTPLSRQELDNMEAYWRACCYLILGSRPVVVTLNSPYNAVISVEPELLEANGLDITLLHELQLEALVFLYPRRFCQSDLLARFARRGFTNIESGFERLTRICN
jgi:hypothetical protein